MSTRYIGTWAACSPATGNKDVLLVRSVSALTLLTGLDPDQGGALDAEGYPVSLDNNMVFARQ